MADFNIQQKVLNSNGTYDNVYPKTKADMVMMSDGMSIEQTFDAHEADYVRQPGYATSTLVNNKLIILDPAPTSYVDGLAVSFKNTVENSTAVTLNINSLGQKPLLKSNGLPLTSGNLKVGSIYTARYNGTSFILQGEGGEYGTATAPRVLAGYTIGTENGLVSGTMPNRAGATVNVGVTRSGTTLRLLATNGYRDGVDDTVTATDANFIATNILSGKSIFGLAGTAIDGAGSKRYATGTVTSASVSGNWYYMSGTVGQNYMVTVSGLSFRPSVILVKYYRNERSYVTQYDNIPGDRALETIKMMNGIDNRNALENGVAHVSVFNGLPYVNNGGFRLPVFHISRECTWVAYE